MRADLSQLLRRRSGHFELESRHHGALWLELESLCRRPRLVAPLADELAQRLRRYEPEILCGPLVEGAFVAMLVAERLDVEFVYAERKQDPDKTGLFPVRYTIPPASRSLEGRRVAIVNDVINAGSAVRGALADLDQCSAEVAAIGTLLTLGAGAQQIANEAGVPLESLAAEPNDIWTPDQCPLCATGAPLTPHPGS